MPTTKSICAPVNVIYIDFMDLLLWEMLFILKIYGHTLLWAIGFIENKKPITWMVDVQCVGEWIAEICMHSHNCSHSLYT